MASQRTTEYLKMEWVGEKVMTRRLADLPDMGKYRSSHKRKKNVWRLAFCPDRAVQPQNDNLENEFDGFFLQIF